MNNKACPVWQLCGALLECWPMGQQFEPWRRCQINSGEDCNFKVKKKQRQKIAKPQTKTLNWKGEGIDESMPLIGRSISTFVETSSMHF